MGPTLSLFFRLFVFLPIIIVFIGQDSYGADTDFILDLIRPSSEATLQRAPSAAFFLTPENVAFVMSLSLNSNEDLFATGNIEGLQTTFPEWKESNISNAHLWPGLVFSGDRLRIASLKPSSLSIGPRTFDWKGKFPASSMLILTELEEFYITNAGLVYGEYPTGILLLPMLRIFEVEGSAFSLPLLDRWPAQLERFAFSRGAFTNAPSLGQLPALASGPVRLTHFECISCGLTCPLPQWLVDKIITGSLSYCAIYGNKLFMIDEIPPEASNCVLSPSITPPPTARFFETNVPDFKFENDRVVAEVYGNAVYTFTKYLSRRTNQLAVYRDEFTGTIFQPWMQLNATAGRGIGRRLFELPRFGAWRTISEDEYRVSASYGNGALVIEYSFFFRGQQKDFVGFDLISYSVIDPQFGQVVGLALEFVLRLEHSNRLPLSCSKFSTLSSFYTNCSSDVLSSPLLGITPTTVEFLLQYRNLRVSADLKIPTQIFVDGAIGFFGQFADVIVHAEPYGHVDAIEKSKLLFPEQYFMNRTRSPAEDQYMAILALIYMPRWTRNITYDPEVRIELLFDPDMLAPEEAVTESSNAVLIGVVVAVVVLIIIAGSVAVVVKVIFPYRRAAAEASAINESSQQKEIDDIEESEEGGNSFPNRWSSSSKPVDLRNTSSL